MDEYDGKLMESVIGAVGTILDGNSLSLSPKKHAKLITSMYEEFSKARKLPVRKEIDDGKVSG